MVKAVLFDFDDTLVTTLQTKISAIQQFAKQYYNYDLSEKRVRQYWGLPYREYIRNIFSEVATNVYTVPIKLYTGVRLS